VRVVLHSSDGAMVICFVTVLLDPIIDYAEQISSSSYSVQPAAAAARVSDHKWIMRETESRLVLISLATDCNCMVALNGFSKE